MEGDEAACTFRGSDQEPCGARFAFGKNWQRFLGLVDRSKIAMAEASLQQMLEVSDLTNRRFLDVGSGSGIFSLAARNLGATVVSFDYDLDSVRCTAALKEKLYPGDRHWDVERGDVLNEEYVEKLEKFDVVYAWGVLHHTGDQWTALSRVAQLVRPSGKLFVALYNDQRWRSRYWKRVKICYNSGWLARATVLMVFLPYFSAFFLLEKIVRRSTTRRRGMDKWRDVFDWLGGYPFEVSTPGQVLEFARSRGFTLIKLTTVGGRHGCNEYVFQRMVADRS